MGSDFGGSGSVAACSVREVSCPADLEWAARNPPPSRILVHHACGGLASRSAPAGCQCGTCGGQARCPAPASPLSPRAEPGIGRSGQVSLLRPRRRVLRPPGGSVFEFWGILPSIFGGKLPVIAVRRLQAVIERARRSNNSRNAGPPSSAVITPTGGSVWNTRNNIRAPRSASTRNAAPSNADAGSNNR